MRARIEYEFEFDLGKGDAYNQEVLDCIEEDTSKGIQKCIDNIIDGANQIGYKITKL